MLLRNDLKSFRNRTCLEFKYISTKGNNKVSGLLKPLLNFLLQITVLFVMSELKIGMPKVNEKKCHVRHLFAYQYKQTKYLRFLLGVVCSFIFCKITK